MSQASATRPTFTLRNLFATVTVLCLGCALVPPCMQAQRSAYDSSFQGACRNNLRNVTMAIYNYEVARGQYPGYVNDISLGESASANNERSAFFVVLPYMDCRLLYDQLVTNNIPNTYDTTNSIRPIGINTSIEVFECPTLFPVVGQLPAPTSYVLNTGQLDAAGSANRSADFTANGVFHRGVPMVRNEKIVTVCSQYIAKADGQSMTVMASESTDARSWTDVQERWIGATYHSSDGQPGIAGLNPLHPLGINVQSGKSHQATPQNSSPGYARPSSFHHGVVYLAFCDGHIRAVSNKISYRVYQALMTPDGRQARDNSHADAPPFSSTHAAANVRISPSDVP